MMKKVFFGMFTVTFVPNGITLRTASSKTVLVW